MSDSALEQQFVARLRALLLSLPYDLKVLLEIMSDEDLQEPWRRVAASAAIYCLLRSDASPDATRVLGYVDDVVLVRLVLNRLLSEAGDGVGFYRDRFAEQLDQLSEDAALIRGYLGDVAAWLERRLERVDELKYKGKSITDYLSDDEAAQRLYQEAVEFATDYEVDDDAAARLTSGQRVLDVLRARKQAEEGRR